MTPTEALLIVAKTQFRPFIESDYDGFMGVESDNPMIGEYEDKVILIDGNVIQIQDCDMNSCYIFNLGDALEIC